MNLPLYMKDAFDYPVAMALATALGFLFGFVLERAGFGRSTVLAAQFYGRDMRVLKVMFSGIVTTTVGLGILGGVGLVDLGALMIPETYLAPQIIGGLALGVGFIVSGYCPGTAVVATASGNVDGVVNLIGVMLGSLGFAALYPALESFYMSGHLGALTFPDLLGVPWVVVALGVAAMAVGSFAFAEWVEGWLARRAHVEPPASPRGLRRGVYMGLAGSAAIGLVTLVLPTGETATASTKTTVAGIAALDLAQQLVKDPAAVYLVDLRDAAACEKDRLPNALCVPDDDPEAKMLADFPSTRTLVVYDADGTAELPTGVTAYRGPVRRLVGGEAAFRSEILTEPQPPQVATPEQIQTYQLKAALHSRFTGQAAVKAPVMAAPKAVKRAVKKGGGC